MRRHLLVAAFFLLSVGVIRRFCVGFNDMFRSSKAPEPFEEDNHERFRTAGARIRDRTT